jgi:predicted Zn finger-like uncharacterized protein
MILTCPECATSYFVDDLKIPRAGRMVKCTSCSARWRAYQEQDQPDAAAADDDLVVEAPREIAPSDDLEFVAAPVAPARKPPQAKPRSRGAVIVTGVLAALVVIGGTAVLLRAQIAGMVPGTAPVFAAIGLPVNMLGLGIEGVVAKETFVAGRPVLAVTGAIRSTADEPAMAPPIRISLLDREGKALSSLVAEPLNAKVPPGGKRYFAVNLPNPPAGAHELEIAFDPGAGRSAPKGETHSAPVEHATPAAAAAAEAQPLPAGSPDALHAPASKSTDHHE